MDNLRLEKITAILLEKGSISVYDLAKEVYVSESTLRRDLNILEQRGVLTRTFGGAVIKNSGSNRDTGLGLREKENVRDKINIAKGVIPFLEDDMVIFIDASSTCLQLVPILNQFHNLTIITSGISLTTQLIGKTKHQIKLLGGDVNFETVSTYGNHTEDMIKKLHVQLAILSTSACDAKFGFSEHVENQAYLKRAVIEQSTKVIFLVQDKKFNHIALAKSVDLSKADVIITNSEVDPIYKEKAPNTVFINVNSVVDNEEEK